MSKSDSVDPVKETCRLIRLARSYWDAAIPPAAPTAPWP